MSTIFRWDEIKPVLEVRQMREKIYDFGEVALRTIIGFQVKNTELRLLNPKGIKQDGSDLDQQESDIDRKSLNSCPENEL